MYDKGSAMPPAHPPDASTPDGDELPNDAQRRALRDRFGAGRAEEVLAVMRHMTPSSRAVLLEQLHAQPRVLPAGAALFRAFASTCDLIAERVCADTEDPAMPRPDRHEGDL